MISFSSLTNSAIFASCSPLAVANVCLSRAHSACKKQKKNRQNTALQTFHKINVAILTIDPLGKMLETLKKTSAILAVGDCAQSACKNNEGWSHDGPFMVQIWSQYGPRMALQRPQYKFFIMSTEFDKNISD